MYYQRDFGFSFDTEGCLWSHQSTCGVRIQQRRVRPRGSHADVFSFSFLSSFFFFSLSTFFQGSCLISLQTWFNTREWIFVWGQIWDIWHWIMDAFIMHRLRNGFSQKRGLYKFLPDVPCHSLFAQSAVHFWFGLMQVWCDVECCWNYVYIFYKIYVSEQASKVLHAYVHIQRKSAPPGFCVLLFWVFF